jgi:hypothetical protein
MVAPIGVGMKKFGWIAFLLLAAMPATAQTLAPHRAAYTLSLGTGGKGDIAAIDGVLAIDLTEVCEGWTIAQRMRFRMSESDGNAADTEIVFSSFESHDGKTYRFSLRTSRDGELVEELRGRASLDPDKGGKAEFQLPETTMDLPPGTMFPTAHSLLLLNLAAGGEKLVSRAVFDGATLDGALDVSALIGSALAGEALLGPNTPTVGNRAGWRVRMAYFNADEQTGVPSYETSMRMLDNGVAADYTFEYPEFTMKAKLERIEALPKPRC